MESGPDATGSAGVVTKQRPNGKPPWQSVNGDGAEAGGNILLRAIRNYTRDNPFRHPCRIALQQISKQKENQKSRSQRDVDIQSGSAAFARFPGQKAQGCQSAYYGQDKNQGVGHIIFPSG